MPVKTLKALSKVNSTAFRKSLDHKESCVVRIAYRDTRYERRATSDETGRVTYETQYYIMQQTELLNTDNNHNFFDGKKLHSISQFPTSPDQQSGL